MIALPGITIHRKIYESSVSLVYRGMRERENCAVIAKVLKQDYPSSQELTRYRQEYAITRSLNIEGVVKAYSQQDYQRTLVILLEDFGGESLEYWMRQQSNFCPMPLSTFLGLAIAITDTLGRIHEAHVIHKDINPGNIVFNPSTGVVKIIDFGIATRFSRTNPTFKSLHLLEGTPAYLSPEQTGRMNRMLDYRTDFYSLGVTFYELLTGQLPFPTSDLPELVHCHIARPPSPPHELNATIPQPVSNLILKLMAKNAEDRYQSAWGIKADLERCAQQLAEVGLIEPMPLGLQDVSEQFCIPQKLYGRAAEIAALLAAFDRVTGNRESGIGNWEKHSTPYSLLPTPLHSEMLLVSGYSGIGKTALVQELHKPITANHGYFISGKFDQFGRNVPYSAIVDALQKLVQQLLGEPDEQVELWRSRLLTALGSNGQVIVDVIPEVELIIGKQPPVPEVGATEAQNRFNLTFQRFVRVFCAKEHPLVIFLDDLQWIDSATLKLIELILLDEQTQYLFLIGAYRDNELTPTHPLVLTLENLRNQGAILQEIILSPLTLEPLSQLVAETLHHHPDTVRSLSQVVLRKTEGNPFFVGEFLKLLYSENLLTFDAQQLSWQWNLAQIEAQEITDNVVELLLCQLQKLPEATQQILCRAACIGAEFDLETLEIVCEKSPKAIFQDLLAAIQAGLIQPLSDLDEDLLVQEYKFLHDRVQQAAYALIDEPQKQVVHLQIGRNLLEKISSEQRADRWGAIAKVKDLENRYPQLLNANLVRQSNPIVTDETIRHPTAAIDLAAVMKAAQALSEIIHLDQLIATLMQVVIENAGAETGTLILVENDQLTVAAQCSGSRQCDLEKIPVAGCAKIPVSVIHSVERTQETLVFDDAVSEASFSTDLYIQNQQTRSLLCMPVLKQSQLVGILYLENNLSTGAFTSDRLQVLKLLMVQAAISLENARLYEQLEDYAETLERKVEAQTQALQQEIIDRERTEDALRQSEANYRNLLQTANSVIIRYDTQGRIHYINDYGVKLLGYEEHEIVGRTLFETIIPDIETSGRDVKPLVHDLLRNPQLYPQGEGENLCRDGRRVWMVWSNQAIFNEQGEVVEILSVGNDTTQRRQAEEALQCSAKFRNIFENSQVGIFRNRISDGLILNANQRLANLLGFDSPEEIIGLERSIDYFVNPSDRQHAHELMKRDGELRSYEAKLRKRDGTVFWGLISSYLNAADGYVEGVVADISDLKQAEVALQASEAELRSLFSAIPDSLWVITAEGRVIEKVEGNPKQLYRPIEEMVGKTLHQIFNKEQADQFLGYIQQALKTQQVVTVEYSLWIAGREIWFSARIAPIQHEQVIWLARDITLQKQAEAASILEERNRIAREIHDTLAQAFTGILIQVDAATQVLTDDVEATQAHLDTIEELSRTGLSEARRSVTALRPQLLEEGDLSSALERLVNQMRVATNTDLIYSIQGVAYSLPAEVENNLLRIGQEALTNAIKYANANEIRIELVYDNAQCRLQVKDDGQGFGVVGVPMSGGFGLLGMSERAERIGAQLAIESQPGQGTEIIVIVNRG